MTTSAYLNSILRILPAVQARQLNDLMNDLKASGEVRNADEYQQKLRELATLINDTVPKPSFKQIRSLVWHLAASEAHNVMMKALKNDIEAIFLQTDEMGKKVDDHHFLIMKNLAADMERGLADQENKIRRLEWLAGQNNEFSHVLVNSFVSSSPLKTPRSEFGAENLYFDNRTYQNKNESELPSAVISEHGQKLLLNTTNESAIHPIAITLLTDSSSYGTQVQTDINNTLANVIDGTKGTFWTRDVYLSAPVEKVTTVLEFNFGTAQDISYMIVEGATETPFHIDSIQGLAPDGHMISLLSTSTEVAGMARIDFDRSIVRAVRVTFSMLSYIRAEYFTDKRNSVWGVLDTNNKHDPLTRVNAAGPVVREALASDTLGDILNIPEGESEQINSCRYAFGLDNVWFGNSKYHDSGIFVSKPLKGKDFGVVAVRTNENITAADVEDSIEYEVVKIDRSPKYREFRFPIPQLNQTTITDERLILTNKEIDGVINDVGALRFCPYVSPSWVPVDGYPISIYKNGELQTIGKDWELAINLLTTGDKFRWVDNFNTAGSDTTDFSNYTLSPAKMWIRIKKPDSSAVYTAGYTIRTSDTYVNDNTVWMDKDKTIFLSDGGRAHIKNEDPDIMVESDLYLQITLRRNGSIQSTTPELLEYAVLAATYS